MANNNFSSLPISSAQIANLETLGYKEMTAIQAQSLPHVLKGKDLIAQAKTGSGKTAAFGIGLLEQINPRFFGVQALVLCPTRELADQVGKELRRLARSTPNIKLVLLCGGKPFGPQRGSLQHGAHIAVGTPGRIQDHLRKETLKLNGLKTLVLDEADRMLDMGFIGDVDAILRKSPMSRQTMLFSATIPDEIKRLAERYMLHPETVTMHTGTRVTSTVEHAFYPVAEKQKESLVVEIMRREKPKKTLIFTATREGTSVLALTLRRRRWKVVSLSSLLSQANRERALTAFRKGEFEVLVATDVAARGLDVQDIAQVIHVDLPDNSEMVTHRSGRTGRAGRKGRSLIFVPPRAARRVDAMLRHAGINATRTDIPNRDDIHRAADRQLIERFSDVETDDRTDVIRLHKVAAELLEDRDPVSVVATLLGEADHGGPCVPRDI
ncbi:MAG: DEAD/DEAH box helicase, partial [Gammaproteobacteria bacterium]|nr:DEAD/DEAH box helicase [Gammaproteobacteria bacterium]